MDGSGSLTVRVIDALAGVDRAGWDQLALAACAARNPFVSYDFLQALEESGCVSARAGWVAHHLLVHGADGAWVGAMPLYLKGHSQGEYVFDHAWADALHRAGGRYYPKLQTAAPFTPATGPRLLTDKAQVREALVSGAIALAQEVGASSWHITFPTAPEADALAGLGLLRRTGVQFHWSNAGYATFDDFLAALSSSRRKVIKRERREALAGRTVRRLSGYDITEADWDFFFACYQDTGGRKWGSPYLNRAFFSLIGERMGKDIILLIAEDAGRPVAAALNFVGGDCLYGRYWGRVADVAFLHFELCYYQAIEIAIERGLARVEAGAQGEHKLARGYAPVATHSAHWIAHPGLLSAVARYLEAERPAVADEIETLDSFTPFKENLS
ncbi:MAG: GNAT family N-acetyltransferase [Caulobacterales bacterium]|jgi:predicted N-acyltransferase